MPVAVAVPFVVVRIAKVELKAEVERVWGLWCLAREKGRGRALWVGKGVLVGVVGRDGGWGWGRWAREGRVYVGI